MLKHRESLRAAMLRRFSMTAGIPKAIQDNCLPELVPGPVL